MKRPEKRRVMADDNDKFVIQFVQNGAEQVIKAAQGLLKIQVDVNQKGKVQRDESKKNEHQFSREAKALASLAATYIGFRKVIGTIVNVAGKGAALAIASDQTGVNTAYLETLTAATYQYGGSLESVTGTLKGLQSALTRMDWDDGSPIYEAMRIFGINPQNADGTKRDQEQLLQEVARVMETLSYGQQQELANILGIDPGTLQLMRKGVAGFNAELEAAKQNQIFDEGDAELWREFDALIEKARRSFYRMFNTVGKELLPAFEAVLNIAIRFFDWLSAHEHVATTGILALSGAVLILTSQFVAMAAGAGTALGTITAGIVAATAAAGVLLAELALIAAAAYGGYKLGEYIGEKLDIEGKTGDALDWITRQLFGYDSKNSPAPTSQTSPSAQLDNIRGNYEGVQNTAGAVHEMENEMSGGDIGPVDGDKNINVKVENEFVISGDNAQNIAQTVALRQSAQYRELVMQYQGGRL